MLALFLSMVGATFVGVGMWNCMAILLERRNYWTITLSLPITLTPAEHNKRLDAFIEELKTKKR